ncbi:MAG: VWA domain-containing protein, partial [Clostridia bacterium]|nr:VWA domain-containing protein [Clostridia bacterium]
DMSSNKKAQNNADGTTTITLSATSDAEKVPVSTDVPVDVILVLDTSSSMQTYKIGKDTRLKILKDKANEFVTTVAEKAEKGNVDHRIAIVSFAESAYVFNTDGTAVPYGQADYTNVFMSAKDNEEIIKTTISNLTYSQGTRADLGMEAAKQVVTHNKVSDDGKLRAKVVIFITDGQPTNVPKHEYPFSENVANLALATATEIKAENVIIYSVGFDISSITDPQMTAFMNRISSNYDSAVSITDNVSPTHENYCISADNAGELSKMFKTVTDDVIQPVKPFADITIFDTISKEFTMTMLQEQAFRQSVINEYGVSNSDISVIVNDDGTTSITVRHLNPKTRNDANGDVIEYYVRISFNVTANEKATGADYYNTNTESAGYMVGGMLVDSFASPRVTVPDDRNIVVFLLGGRVYTITEANIGDEIAVPVTSYAEWNVPEGYTVSQSYTEFEAEFTSNLRTVTWRLADEDIVESYHAGEPISVYQAESIEGKKFLGWDKEIPFAMPDRDLVLVAQYEDHTHKWSKEPVTQFGTCDDGITYLYACECGETYTVHSEPCAHKLTATITNIDELSYAIVTCENCGYIQEKYITYKAEYTEEDYEGNVNATSQTIDLKMYDANDVSVQPDGTIAIVVPATSQMLHDDNLRIYRINEDGTTEEITFTKDDDRDVIIMVVDHFSYYVITASNETEANKTYKRVKCGLTKGHDYVLKTVKATCDEDGCKKYVCSHCGDSYVEEYIPAKGHSDKNGDGKCDACSQVIGEACHHMCHSTKWYIKIIWFIINLFNRLFHINQFCECGKAHY